MSAHEHLIKAAQCAHILRTDLRAAHSAACNSNNLMLELLLRGLLTDAAGLEQRLVQIRLAAEQCPQNEWPLYTSKANEAFALQRDECGDPDEVEHYYCEGSPGKVVYLMTEEREEFELEKDHKFLEDTLPTETFEQLIAWLKEEGAL